MKLNISIKVKNEKDPLTSSYKDVENEVDKLFQKLGTQAITGAVNYTRKAIVDKNGNTTGYNVNVII